MAEAIPVGEDGAVIREHHCAVRDVAERFPEVCAAEQDLMERLLGVPVRRTGHLLAGCSACEYTALVPLTAGDRGTRPAAPRAADAEQAISTTTDPSPCTCASHAAAHQEQA